MTARCRLVNVQPRIGHEYRADIQLDGNVVGWVARQDGKNLGYRSGQYRAYVGGIMVATGETLEILQAELREHFAAENPDARESW